MPVHANGACAETAFWPVCESCGPRTTLHTHSSVQAAPVRQTICRCGVDLSSDLCACTVPEHVVEHNLFCMLQGLPRCSLHVMGFQYINRILTL